MQVRKSGMSWAQSAPAGRVGLAMVALASAVRALLVLWVMLLLPLPAAQAQATAKAATASTPATSAATPAAPRTLLILGDSISAGYGLPRDAGWVRLLTDRIRQNGLDYSVVNASISGDTTSGGRARLPALLKQHAPEVVVIELGGNDGLRGLDIKAMEDNLAAMTDMARKAGARVLLVGMRLPPNYGRDYTNRFEAVYGRLARKLDVPLVPFFFTGFGEGDEWFQADRIHPTVRAQPVLLDNVWPQLQKLLAQRRK